MIGPELDDFLVPGERVYVVADPNLRGRIVKRINYSGQESSGIGDLIHILMDHDVAYWYGTKEVDLDDEW